MSTDAYRFDNLPSSGLAAAIRAESLRGASDHGTCRHCDRPIHFAPYFLDGKLPNPPKWIHSHSGTTTCSRPPTNWQKHSWPHAEPS